MLRASKLRISFILLLFFPLFAWAQSDQSRYMIIAPHCLTTQLNAPHHTLATTHSFALLSIDEIGLQQLITAKKAQTKLCGGFMDVTQQWESSQLKHAKNPQYFLISMTSTSQHPSIATTYEIKYQKEVNQLFTQLNTQNMWDDLTTLSNFQDRYANSDNGINAAQWINTEVQTIAKNNQRTDVSTYFIDTGKRYKQPSLVVKIGDAIGPGVVIGAHMDTLQSTYSKKPGADDDGSGSVTVLAIARTLLSSGLHFKKPIYLVWYAAEEEGLVGSGYVVSDFKNKNVPVAAVLHFDMTGFAYRNDPTMWLMKDYVDTHLVSYLETLITTYVKEPVKYSSCGYACSDHATWTQNGYAASIAAEAAYENTNPAMHSSQDTMDKLSLNHMTDYLKLGTAFAVELAEPIA